MPKHSDYSSMEINKHIPTGLIDPSIEQGGQWDINNGDMIIAESVVDIIERQCGLKIEKRVPSLRKLSSQEYAQLRSCKFLIVGGTNLLTSHMLSYKQWMINLLDSFYIRNIILCGVGWWQYQSPPDLYTTILLKRILNRQFFHSVRDNYSKNQLQAAGIKNVLNTSCPTLWGISRELQSRIPEEQSDEVVTTITCYNKKPKDDKDLIELLNNNYSRVYLWPQGPDDKEYICSLNVKVEFINIGVKEYDKFLENNQVDYVGKRLHGGIRAIQKGKRTLILKIDNRAAEIGRDTNLNIKDSSDFSGIKSWINSKYKTDINLPTENIRKWIEQFKY